MKVMLVTFFVKNFSC